MEIRPDWGCDSGFFFRSTEWGAAYQVTMDYLARGSMGSVIGEGGLQGVGGRGRGGNRGAAPAAGAATPAGQAAAPVPAPPPAPVIIPGKPLGSETATGDAPWMKVWKREDWNSVRVRVEGDVPHVTVWINDQQITDFTDTENHALNGMIEGPIAIQVHGGASRWVQGGFWRWRNIGIKELR
jgi:hypothetical protein